MDDRFVLDEVRNRFVYPNDKRFVVYIEWDGPAGDHTLTAIWKDPDGRVNSISPDIRLQTTKRDFAAYWEYQISPDAPSGFWSLDVRIDGKPAGSHFFELVIPAKTPEPSSTVRPVAPTPDEIYRAIRSSVVWVHKLDNSGRRIDTGSGFVLAPGQVATAFQMIDAATRVEVEFEDGRKVSTDELWAWRRLEDWAVLKADTGSAAPLRTGDASRLAVTERLLTFNVEGNLTRVFGGIDLAGRRNIPTFGERLLLSPALASEAVGGPLLNSAGAVVGVIGGTTLPGGRFGRRDMGMNPALYLAMVSNNAATPINLIQQPGSQPSTLSALRDAGTLSPTVVPTPSFAFGATSLEFKGPANALPQSLSEFSRKDPQIWVYSMWQRKDKTSRGIVSAEVYDAANRTRVRVSPKRINIPTQAPLRYGFAFSPQALEAGPYRVDLLFDGQTIWRTFLTITD